MLPVRAVTIGAIFYSFVSTPWFGLALSTLDVAVETVQYIFWFYALASVVLAVPLLNLERLPLAVVQWTVVTSSLVDGLFIAGMTLITGGLDSTFFWLFVVLIIRNAVSIPPGFSGVVGDALGVGVRRQASACRGRGRLLGHREDHRVIDRG